MKYNLLSSLRKYNKTKEKDPLENFITGAFAWILNNHQEFSLFFMNEVIKMLGITADGIFNKEFKLEWNAQKYFDGYYPDMVCEIDDIAFIFEHKAYSSLHENQLSNYRNYAAKKYTSYYLVLITANPMQHEQKPDLALCWYDVYNKIDSWLSGNGINDSFIFEDFQNLLKHEGLGPPAPISHSSILSYYETRYFRHNIRELVNRAYCSIYRLNYAEELEIIDSFGRIGLSLFKDWTPGIFIGFLLDGEDHCTKPVLGESSPDFSIIISMNLNSIKNYATNKYYKEFADFIDNEIKKLNKGWDFYHHIKDKNVPEINYWHPMHIRKPMLELFRGTINPDEQDTRLMEAANEILPLILNSVPFKNLKRELSEQFYAPGDADLMN